MNLAFHIIVTILMVLAALLQVAVLRDPLSPNWRNIGAFRWLVTAGFFGLAVRLVQMGLNDYEPPVSGLGLLAMGLLGLGQIGLQLDRLGLLRDRPFEETLPSLR